MPEFNEILKSFTRFFIPGLAFFFFCLLVPAFFWIGSDAISRNKELLSPSVMLLASLLLGYVLDAIKGYRWTLSYRAYIREKSRLTNSLAPLCKISSENPDVLISRLWLKEREVYERIFVERAEWVMILETSFALLVSSLVLFLVMSFEFFRGQSLDFFGIGVMFVFFIASWISSRNGIDRMVAHDEKLVAAVAECNS